MKHRIPPFALVPALLLGAALGSVTALAGHQETKTEVVALRTGEGELIEADVSGLTLGESRSYVTDSGSVVDIIRAAEGLEIWLDGELLEGPGGQEAVHAHVERLHEEVMVECESSDAGACEKHFVYAYDTDVDVDHDVMVMRKHVEIACDEGEDCDTMVWVSGDDDEMSFGDLDGLHADDDRKVVIIKKEHREVIQD